MTLLRGRAGAVTVGLIGFLFFVEFVSGILQGFYVPLIPDLVKYLGIRDADFNIFEGRTVRGIPSHTIAQGRIAFARGELRAEPGTGRYLKRPPFGPQFDAAAKRAHDLAPTAVAR